MMKFTAGLSIVRFGLASTVVLALTASMATPANATPLDAQPSGMTAIAPSSGSQSVNGTDAKPDEARIAWAPILTAVIAAGGSADYMGKEAALRMYYAGLRNAEYQQLKWSMRAMVIGAIGPILGGIFLVSFENKFYSMV